MTKLVSILIPAYNSDSWIDLTIKSALNQTWKRKEIIIIDDGSYDNTRYIAKKYESKYVKILSQNNKGASAARNKALSIAQGDYIQWLDADDLLAPDKIELQLRDDESTGDDQILLSSAWGKFYYRKERAKFIPDILWQDLTPVEWISMKMRNNTYMAIESWLVSRKLTEMAGPWDERLSLDDDGEYFCRVVSCSKKIRFIINSKSFCRHGNSLSMSSIANISNKKMESQTLSISMQINHLLSLNDSALTRLSCLRLLQNYYIYCYPERNKFVIEFNEYAIKLGGKLSEPEINRKYILIKKLFGMELAKKASILFPCVKDILFKDIDRLIYVFSGLYFRSSQKEYDI